MADINGFEANEEILFKEDVKFIDQSGKQINGDLVITNRRIIFMKKRQILHANTLETVRGAHAESRGQVGAYFSIDLELPDGLTTTRYKGSVAQANHVLGFVESVVASGGTVSQTDLNAFHRSSARVSVKSSFDSLCQGGLCCMWLFVGLIFRLMFMGATITPGAELIPGGYILLVIVVTYWWVGIKGKKAWLCYGIEVGSDKAKPVHVGKKLEHTTPRATKGIRLMYGIDEEMTDPLKCPLCGAVFSYRKGDIIQNRVKCQNCLDDFIIE
ncbi:MAG: hypothetical protein OEV85_13975 [Candidatus Thorarchaeota archaeon]|nr:hypothetical protein [Candidatus Thorarchaeota archaeon]